MRFGAGSRLRRIAPGGSGRGSGGRAIVVGQERRGLGDWGEVCAVLAAIPMPGPPESLNAAIAGSIALYEASRRTAAVREKPFI